MLDCHLSNKPNGAVEAFQIVGDVDHESLSSEKSEICKISSLGKSFYVDNL
jgi:hypothetical protein